MKIMFVGGGTGGHFYPLIAIAEAVIARAAFENRPTPELYYIGPEPYDKPSLDAVGMQFVSCPSGKIRRYASILNFLDVFVLVYGFFVALGKLFKIY